MMTIDRRPQGVQDLFEIVHLEACNLLDWIFWLPVDSLHNMKMKHKSTRATQIASTNENLLGN